MKLLTINEVSEITKVKKSTLYSWANSGKIPSFKLHGLLRFDMAEIENWIEESRIKPVSLPKSFKRTSGSQDIDAIIKRAIKDVKSGK